MLFLKGQRRTGTEDSIKNSSHFLESWLSLISLLVLALCAESFQLSKRFYSRAVKYYSFWKAQITDIPFMKTSQLKLISLYTSTAWYLLLWYLFLMPLSRKQNTSLIHMCITCGGAYLNVLQIVGAQNKLNPVKTSSALKSKADLSIRQNSHCAKGWSRPYCLLSKNPPEKGSQFSFIYVLYYVCMWAQMGPVSISFPKIHIFLILPWFLFNVLISHMFSKWVIEHLRRSYV